MPAQAVPTNQTPGGSWTLVYDQAQGRTIPRWVPDNYFPQTGLNSDIPDATSGPGGGWDSTSKGWGYNGPTDDSRFGGGAGPSQPTDPSVGFNEFTDPTGMPPLEASQTVPSTTGTLPGLDPSLGAASQTPSIGHQFIHALTKADVLAPIISGTAGYFGTRANANAQRDVAAINDKRTRDMAYMDTFAMDPVSQQKDIYRAAVLRQIGAAGPASLGHQPNLDLSTAQPFLSNDALAQNASRFYEGAQNIRPTAPPFDPGRAGFNGPQSGTPYHPTYQPPGSVPFTPTAPTGMNQPAGSPNQAPTGAPTGHTTLQDYFARRRAANRTPPSYQGNF